MAERFNEPNYCAYVMGFFPGCLHCEVEFSVEQVCGTGKKAVETVNNRIVEDVEALAAKTGLQYRVCVPGDYRNPKWYNDTRRVNVAW